MTTRAPKYHNGLKITSRIQDFKGKGRQNVQSNGIRNAYTIKY